MKPSHFRAFFALAALLALVVGSGCVADRPSRNGVFNENQYVRKASSRPTARTRIRAGF
jgi:hypothetical protein